MHMLKCDLLKVIFARQQKYLRFFSAFANIKRAGKFAAFNEPATAKSVSTSGGLRPSDP